MTAKTNHARAPRGASGTCRKRRRPQGGAPAWMRPFCRASYALHASVRLINSTLRTVARSRRCAHRRPIRTSQNLNEAAALLSDASARLQRMVQELAATNECVARAPEGAEFVPELLFQAAECWLDVTVRLQQTADEVFSLHEDVLHGLETGTLIPEQPAAPRPYRISLAPRPVPIRAFLRLRQPRVVDRIAPILRRRRRTPRPASVRVPQRSFCGRAPPLFPIPCSDHPQEIDREKEFCHEQDRERCTHGNHRGSDCKLHGNGAGAH